MGRIRRIVMVGAACLGLLACSSRSNERGVTGQRISPKALAPRPEKPPPLNTPFDAQGQLKPSGTSVGWLEIPMGFSERPSSQGTHHAFVGKLPVQAVTRFLDQRVFTGQVELSGNGVKYVAARPKNLDPKAAAYEIAVYPNREGDTVQLFIDERTVSAAPPLSLDAARALLKEKQARAE